MIHPGRITLATSIPPLLSRMDCGREVGAVYQRLCVESWLACGVGVVSLNDPEEIASLSAAFPEIAFLPAGRNASAIGGKKTPFIADLLTALVRTDAETVGILNADIVMEPSRAWVEDLPQAVAQSIIGAHRFDISAFEGSAPRLYPRGFDLFLFRREDAENLARLAGDFAMGLPWWDCWLPAAAAVIGRDFRALGSPRIAHLTHEGGYSLNVMHAMSKRFASFIATTAPVSGECPARLALLAPPCRAFAAALPFDEKALGAFNEAVLAWHDVWTSGAVNADAPGPERAPNSPAAAIFTRFEERIAAHAFLLESIALERNGAMSEADTKLAMALKICPNEYEILAMSGEFRFRRGRIAEAIGFLQKAVGLQKDSPRALNSLGVVLKAAGRREEAIACFERVLRAAADFPDAYFNLAVTLRESGRKDAALRCVERGIAAFPDSDDLKSLHRHFSAGR